VFSGVKAAQVLTWLCAALLKRGLGVMPTVTPRCVAVFPLAPCTRIVIVVVADGGHCHEVW
jgi:hypothetical protein